jgi:hypothetical protein
VDVPLDHKMREEELKKQINMELKKRYPNYDAIIEIDYGFLS